jgi:hypothetical protein
VKSVAFALAFVLAPGLAASSVADEDARPSRLDPHDRDARFSDLHKRAPPHEDATPSPRVKSALKRLLDWPGTTGEQYGLDDESTRGEPRDVKNARTTPKYAPR